MQLQVRLGPGRGSKVILMQLQVRLGPIKGSKTSVKRGMPGSKPLMTKSQLLKKRLQQHMRHMAAATMCMASLSN